MVEQDAQSGAGGSELQQLLGSMITRAWQECERYESTLPHLLVCVDVSTGEESFSGPFASREDAEEVLVHEVQALGADTDLDFRTVALFPGLELRTGALPSALGDRVVGSEVVGSEVG